MPKQNNYSAEKSAIKAIDKQKLMYVAELKQGHLEIKPHCRNVLKLRRTA